jgi:hypothetical protein
MSIAPYNYGFVISGTTYYHPAFPGAWLIDENNSAIPIFTSISNFGYSNLSFGSIDDNYVVVPGYMLVVYTAINYGGSQNGTTIDNTNGKTPLRDFTNFLNSGLSCKLYYKGTLISEPI